MADILGVRLGENLSSNEVLILTEGAEDEVSIRHLLRSVADAKSISKIDFLSSYGAGNIHYLFQSNKNFYKKVIEVLDHDKAGMDAVKNLNSFGMHTSSIFTVPLKIGFKEHELEDLFELNWKLDLLQKAYGRNFDQNTAQELKAKFKCKFSNWVVQYLKTQGVPVDNKEVVKSVL